METDPDPKVDYLTKLFADIVDDLNNIHENDKKQIFIEKKLSVLDYSELQKLLRVVKKIEESFIDYCIENDVNEKYKHDLLNYFSMINIETIKLMSKMLKPMSLTSGGSSKRRRGRKSKRKSRRSRR